MLAKLEGSGAAGGDGGIGVDDEFEVGAVELVLAGVLRDEVEG